MRRARRWMVAGCAVLVVVAGGLLWYGIRHERGNTGCVGLARAMAATARVGDVVLTEEPRVSCPSTLDNAWSWSWPTTERPTGQHRGLVNLATAGSRRTRW